ncbi:hypothetical protein MPL1032_270051 [Mesorhizobium plurifarium]|uniref:Uncharacterized protein n=1 Tax=Mesorhizobium plurifarium TaxID=69974 RepID=A0A0K2W1Y3_MESPL|nr:hypothetical protein MPL1032_270051 [Mesorhizobium plurifarium]
MAGFDIVVRGREA